MGESQHLAAQTQNVGSVYVRDYARVHLGDNYHNVVMHIAPEEMSAESKQRALLSGLAYQDMNTRRNQLANQQFQAPEWIWSKVTSPGFAEWLTGPEPIYYISGKPAICKSTLMKYIADHEKCAELLQERSQQPWLCLHFFFDFRAHKATSNTLEGLCRSLLFQLAETSPLIAASVSSSKLGKFWDVQHNQAAIEPLQLAIRDCIIKTNSRVCLFIDGLDEYEGSYVDLLECLKFKGLIDGRQAKICVASRPERALQVALENVPQLEMQKHNHGTIAAYAWNALNSGSNYSLDQIQITSLVDALVRDAQGVILWAQLVCADIVEGILSQESYSELLLRLASYPPDLDGVYKRLFEKVDERFKLETLLTLHMIRTYPNGLTQESMLLTPGTLRDMLGILRDLDVLPMYPNTTISLPIFRIRLHARLGGLIDVISEIDPDTLTETNHIRLFHKTLAAYLDKHDTLTSGLTKGFLTKYPDHHWLRAYAAYVEQASPSIPSDLSKVVDFEALWASANSPELIDEDNASTVPRYTYYGLDHTGKRVSYNLSALSRAIDGLLIRLETIHESNFPKPTVQSLLTNPLLTLHIFQALHPTRCTCQWRNAKVYGHEFLARTLDERAFLFCLSHGLWMHAVKFRESLTLTPSLRSEACMLLLERGKGRIDTAQISDYNALQREIAPHLPPVNADDGSWSARLKSKRRR